MATTTSRQWPHGNTVCIIITGLGFGISTFATVVVIGHTFTSRRPLALGVCMAGVGAGMIVFPPVYTMLLEMYGLRGLFLITAGLFLNNAVLGIFLRSSQKEVRKSSLPWNFIAIKYPLEYIINDFF